MFVGFVFILTSCNRHSPSLISLRSIKLCSTLLKTLLKTSTAQHFGGKRDSNNWKHAEFQIKARSIVCLYFKIHARKY